MIFLSNDEMFTPSEIVTHPHGVEMSVEILPECIIFLQVQKCNPCWANLNEPTQ
jgi:hypothetical protein